MAKQKAKEGKVQQAKQHEQPTQQAKQKKHTKKGKLAKQNWIIYANLVGAAVIAVLAYINRDLLRIDRRVAVPTTPVPIVAWPTHRRLADFAGFAEQEYARHRTPILFKGVGSALSGGTELWASPREHLEALIAADSPTARPKVSQQHFFQYFSTPKQDEWRDVWGVEPPATSFRWDMESSSDELRDLLVGRRARSDGADVEGYGYWILRTDEVPDVAEAFQKATPHPKSAFAGPDLRARRVSPVTGQPLQMVESLFWMTSPGVANNMHYDNDWNYLLHASGPKRVLLAPPEDAWRLQARDCMLIADC